MSVTSTFSPLKFQTKEANTHNVSHINIMFSPLNSQALVLKPTHTVLVTPAISPLLKFQANETNTDSVSHTNIVTIEVLNEPTLTHNDSHQHSHHSGSKLRKPTHAVSVTPTFSPFKF